METMCRMVDEGYDFTLIAEKLNRTALATRGKYERHACVFHFSTSFGSARPNVRSAMLAALT